MILLDNSTNLLPLLIKAARLNGFVLVPSVNATGAQADILVVPWFVKHNGVQSLLSSLLDVIKDQYLGYDLQEPEQIHSNRVRQVIRLKSRCDFKALVINYPMHL